MWDKIAPADGIFTIFTFLGPNAWKTLFERNNGRRLDEETPSVDEALVLQSLNLGARARLNVFCACI